MWFPGRLSTLGYSSGLTFIMLGQSELMTVPFWDWWSSTIIFTVNYCTWLCASAAALKDSIKPRNGNSANFFLYAGSGKYFEELFTLNLNGVIVSGWYVSSASVAQHARLPDWLRRVQRNKAIRNKENWWRLLLKWNIDMKIQWHVLCVHALKVNFICYNS